MNKIKTLLRAFSFVAALAVILGAVAPAKAFYLEIPSFFKILLQSAQAQDAGDMAPALVVPGGGDYGGQPGGTGAPGSGGTGMPGSGDGGMMPGGMGMPGSGGDQSGGGNYGPGPGMQGPGGGEGMMGPGNQGGPSAADMARQLKDMKRGAQQMTRQLKQFETMMQSMEKKGIVVSEDIKSKAAQVKAILDKVNAAASAEELQDVDLGEAGNLMQELEETRRNVFEQAQQMENVKRGMKGMDQGIKSFEKQLAKLAKQKIAVPADIQETLDKVKAIAEAVKNAKTMDEMQTAGLDDLQDLMQTLNDKRNQLEMLARWPQTAKQMDKELARVGKELKRSKTIVDRLAKKGIDLGAVYNEFESAVAKLKAVRDEAAASVQSGGDPQDIFNKVQEDFFGQMEDTMQNQQVIMMMSNLGAFNSQFKQGMAQVDQTVRALKRKKIDTAELESIVSETKTKGAEALALFKAQPIDTEAIVTAMDEMQNLRQEFENKVAELTGQEENMPWESGPQQFKQINMPQGVGNFMNQNGGGGPGGPGGGGGPQGGGPGGGMMAP